MANAVRSSLWNPCIYKILPDTPEAADWPAEKVVAEVKRVNPALWASMCRGTDISPSTGPARERAPPSGLEDPLRASTTGSSRSRVILAVSTVSTALAASAGAAAYVGRKRQRGASPPPASLDRTLASRNGAFTSWWTAASYDVFSALGFDRLKTDQIHATTMTPISDRFKALHAERIKNGALRGKWGDATSMLLASYLPHSAGVRLSPYVDNEDLLSVTHNNLATDWAIGTLFKLICAASRSIGGAMTCVSPLLVPALLLANTTSAVPPARAAALQKASDITGVYIDHNGKGPSELWAPVHVPGHYITLVHVPAEKKLLVLDPLGRTRAMTRTTIANAFSNWLVSSLGRERPTIHYIAAPTQTDATSCGPFICAYILYALLHDGRPPPASAWSGANANVLRSVAATILHTGKVPLPNGGAFDAAVAGGLTMAA